MTSLKSVPIGNFAVPDVQIIKHSATCNEYATRLDFETIEIPGEAPGPFISGLRMYCAGQPEPQLVNYLNVKQVFQFPLAQVMGESVPTGITGMRASWNQLVLASLGYARSSAGSGAPSDRHWSQQQEADGPQFAPDCVLKAVELQVSIAVHGAILTFDCDPRPRPPPSRSQPQPPAVSPLPLSSTTHTPSSTTSGPTLTLPPTSPAPTTITVTPTPFTSTITVGSGANATVFTTVIQPTPFISVLPPGAAITNVVAQPGSPTTAIASNSPVSVRDGGDPQVVPLGFILGLATALLVAGVVIGVLLFVRRRRSAKKETAIEMVDMSAASPAAQVVDVDVDPPSYLLVPIPRMEAVAGVDEAVPGESSGKAEKQGADGADDQEEDGELQLPGSTSVEDGRL